MLRHRIVASIAAVLVATATLVADPAQATSTTGVITGTVTSAVEGGNAGDGYIYVWNSAGANVWTQQFSAGSMFQITLSAGSYRLEIDSSNGPGVNALSPFFVGGTALADAQVISVTAGATTALGTVAVPQGGTISGTISHQDHNLLQMSLYNSAGTRIRAFDLQYSGAFAFTGLPPGNYRVGGSIRYYSGVARPEYWNNAYTLNDATPITITGTQSVSGIDIVLDPYAAISGTVTYDDGNGVPVPAQDVTVRVVELGDSHDIRTDDDGTYSIVAPPGTYHVRFSGGQWSPAFATQFYGGSALLAESATVSIGMAPVGGVDATMLAGATISGVAVTPGNSNLPYVIAQMVDPITREFIDVSSGVLAHGGTDAYGAYMVQGLPSGTYVLRFLDSDDEPWAADEYWDDAIDIDDATLIHLNVGERVSGYNASLDRPRPATIYGFVTNTGDLPLAGVAVVTEGASTITDANGAYHLSPVSVGWHTLTFTPPSGSPYLAATWVNPSDGVSQSLYVNYHDDVWASSTRLYRPATIQGTVSGVRSPDAEVLTATVQGYRDASQSWVDVDEVDVDATGTWISTGVPPGRYRVLMHYRGPEGSASRTSPTLTIEEAVDEDWSAELRPWTRDINGDTWQDVLYRDSLGHLMVYTGTGTGGFAGKTQLGGTSWGNFTAVVNAGHFDADDVTDVIARSSGGYLYLYRGNGVGGFTRTTISTSSFWKSQTVIISPGDFDGDGFTDLISRDSNGYLWLHRGNGSGGIASKIKIGSTGWKSFTAVLPVGDFNEDGAPDLAARDSSGRLWLYPGNGVGGFSPRQQIASGWGGLTAIRGVGDFNGDWHPDVIARDSSGYLWLYRGNGSAGFGGKVKIGSSSWKVRKLAS